MLRRNLRGDTGDEDGKGYFGEQMMKRKGRTVEVMFVAFFLGVYVTAMVLFGRWKAQERQEQLLREAQNEMKKTMDALNQEQRQFVAMRQRWQKGQVENTYAWEYGLERETKEVKAELLAIRRN